MDLTPAIRCFAREPRILTAYVLGSAARDALRPDSDIDFGLLLHPGETLSALELNDLASDMTCDFGRPVDLGLISSRNLIYAAQCLLTGREVFCRDALASGLQGASLLGLAMQLEFERREVVHAYSA